MIRDLRNLYGIVNYVEILVFIHLNHKIKKSETYRKLTMPRKNTKNHMKVYRFWYITLRRTVENDSITTP